MIFIIKEVNGKAAITNYLGINENITASWILPGNKSLFLRIPSRTAPTLVGHPLRGQIIDGDQYFDAVQFEFFETIWIRSWIPINIKHGISFHLDGIA